MKSLSDSSVSLFFCHIWTPRLELFSPGLRKNFLAFRSEAFAFSETAARPPNVRGRNTSTKLRCTLQEQSCSPRHILITKHTVLLSPIPKHLFKYSPWWVVQESGGQGHPPPLTHIRMWPHSYYCAYEGRVLRETANCSLRKSWSTIHLPNPEDERNAHQTVSRREAEPFLIPNSSEDWCPSWERNSLDENFGRISVLMVRRTWGHTMSYSKRRVQTLRP